MDPTKLLQSVNDLIAKLKGIAPHHWKGNDSPNPHHFDAGSITADAGALLDTQQFWVSFAYMDGGVSHSVKATMPMTAPGTPGGGDIIEYDGTTETNEDFVIGYRIGLDLTGFYHRIVCTFHFTDNAGVKHNLRFDGDL